MNRSNQLMDVISRLGRMTRRGHRRHGHGHGRGSMRILRVIKHEGPIGSKELAEKLDIRPASLSEALDKLEDRNQIVRTTDPTDKRKTIISLSEEAKEKMAKRKEHHDEREELLLSVLTPTEQETFITLANKMIDALNSHHSSE